MNTVRDAVVIASAGAVGLAIFGWPVLRAWRARSWPQADGTIVEARGIDDIDY